MKFYAVAHGRMGPRIYTDWEQCKADVSGFQGAVYKSFPTREQASEWIKTPRETSTITFKVYEKPKTPELVDTTTLTFYGSSKELKPLRDHFRWSKTAGGVVFKSDDVPTVLTLLPKREYRTLYVDGGHNRQTGDEAWACVVDETGRDMIREWTLLLTDMQLKRVTLPVGDRTVAVSNFTDVTSQQNNGAELLSMLIALRISQHATVGSICSDSKLLVDYWSRGHANSVKDAKKLAYIQECGRLRRLYTGEVKKISGASNPADLGYH